MAGNATLKFQNNVPVTVMFPYGDFKEKPGQWGTSFMYSVEVSGDRKILYATKFLHDKIQLANIERGSILTIEKVSTGGDQTDWKVTAEDGQPVTPQRPYVAPKSDEMTKLGAAMWLATEHAVNCFNILFPGAEPTSKEAMEQIGFNARTIFIQYSNRGGVITPDETEEYLRLSGGGSDDAGDGDEDNGDIPF